ncbi:hypothetical protein GXW82_31690 [Streptacidiphilus sp. 4-A2]|nr:hypothetical protein [Streptacidiphilus sp. 4-A2]
MAADWVARCWSAFGDLVVAVLVEVGAVERAYSSQSALFVLVLVQQSGLDLRREGVELVEGEQQSDVEWPRVGGLDGPGGGYVRGWAWTSGT